MEIDPRPLISICTSTYNRAHLLPRIYKSILEQTNRNFEWIIVDDGSDDETEELVKKWIQEAPCPIVYHKQPNSGLHIAINRGAELASGTLFFWVEDDDWLTPNSIEIIQKTWESIPYHEKDQYEGIRGLCADPLGKIIGSRFPKYIFDSNTIEIVTKHGASKSDRAGATRTDLMRTYAYPENIGKYCLSSLVWNRIAISYNTRFINEILQIKDYQCGGITDKRKKMIKLFPESHRIYSKEYLAINNLLVSPKRHIYSMKMYIQSSLHAGFMPWKQVADIKSHLLLWFIILPIGIFYYVIAELDS